MMRAQTDYDYLFKILIVGESGVGKSCILVKFVDGTFAESESFISTIGVDFKIKTVTLNDRKVKLQIWDTAGQERYRTIVSSFYRGTHGIMLVFDVTDINSFLKVRHWISEIKRMTPENTPLVLVGNKSDMTSKRIVEATEAMAFAEKSGIKYFETSAKTGQNIDPAFMALGELCVEHAIREGIEPVKEDKLQLEQKQQSSWCC